MYCVALEGRNPLNFIVFQLQHFVVAPTSGIEPKLNAGAVHNHKPSPMIHGYQNISILKRLYGEVAIAQTLPFKSVVDIQTITSNSESLQNWQDDHIHQTFWGRG